MVTKGLATLAIAASLVTATAGIAFAKGPGSSQDQGRHDFFKKGLEMKVSHRATVRGSAGMPAITQCTFAAIDTRDTADMSAFDAHQLGMKAALSARKASVTAALALTVEADRAAALEKAHQEFKSTIKKLKETLKTAQRSAQQTFKTEHKACNDTKKASTEETSKS